MGHPTSALIAASQMPLITQLRRNHLLKYIDLSGKGLEIGPYGTPTIFKAEADISYLDWKTRDQLVKECSYSDQIDSIPETDYLVTSNDYKRFVPDTFDYIIANHVLEHVPNLIQWLSDVAAMLNPNGVLYMALPDKKFTFDKYRSNTKLSHLLSDFYERVQVISSEHLLDSEIYYDLAFIGQPMVVSERLDRARLEAVLSRGAHIGYHCHIFESETVLDMIFKPIFMMGYLPLDILEFVPAKAEHGGEMIIICKTTFPRPSSDSIDLKSFYKCDYETENEILQQKIELLEKEKSDIGLEIETLKQKIDQSENEKRAMLESKSWRITRPLRKIAHMFN